MNTTEQWIQEAWNAGICKLISTSQRIGAAFPHGSHDGRFQLMSPHYWTADFLPGLLWLAYREGQADELRQLAERCEQQLDAVLHGYEQLDHDMGLMWTLCLQLKHFVQRGFRREILEHFSIFFRLSLWG